MFMQEHANFHTTPHKVKHALTRVNNMQLRTYRTTTPDINPGYETQFYSPIRELGRVVVVQRYTASLYCTAGIGRVKTQDRNSLSGL